MTKPKSARERLAEIRRICVESFENYGHRSPVARFWLIDVDMGREIYRLTTPALTRKPRGRKKR